MPELTRTEALRLLSSLEDKRQAAIDAGDIDELDKIDRRSRDLERALAGGPERGRDVATVAASPSRPGKDKFIAGLLAFFLGGFGIHKFYLGQTGMGIVYLLFFWTFIPAIIAFFEAIIYFVSDADAFAAKYG